MKSPPARLYIVILVLTFTSCVGFPNTETVPDRAVREQNDVEELLNDGSLAAAASRLVVARESGILSSYFVDERLGTLESDFYTRYEEALAEGRFRDALSMLRNFQVLSTKFGESDTIDGVYFKWAESLKDDEEYVQALSVFNRISALTSISSEVLFEFRELANETNNYGVLARINLELSDREVLSEIAEPEKPSANDLLSGTVTIWVNKGIRITNGVGVPDRVIGSGFFVDPRGYVITNYHVIASEVDPEYEGYSRLFVKLPGNPEERIPARVVGYDRIFDLALLKVEIDAPRVFAFSDIRELDPGEPVYALGSPGGLDSTITSGIVSASGRRFLQIGDTMQVDVPINPGNSGGPLVLPDGQVAGVVFAGIEQFEGVNFAVPAFWIRMVLPNLYTQNEVIHPWTGMSVRKSEKGLEVTYVVPTGPSADSGFEVGDIIQEIDGRPTTHLSDAQALIMEREAGEILTVTVLRNDSVIERLAVTGERPFSPVEDLLDTYEIEDLFPVLFGMRVDEIGVLPWGTRYVISRIYPGSIADESSLSVADPFALRNWRIDNDLRAAFIEIIIKKRKAGFLESGVQLGAYLEIDTFI